MVLTISRIVFILFAIIEPAIAGHDLFPRRLEHWKQRFGRRTNYIRQEFRKSNLSLPLREIHHAPVYLIRWMTGGRRGAWGQDALLRKRSRCQSIIIG